jgi:CHASE3 domain sensor protein
MTIGKKIAGIFVLTVLMVVVVGVLAFLSTIRLVEHNRWVSHTYKVLTELGELQLLVKDGDAGSRAYVITGLPTDAAPAKAAIAT